jgi:hypothetical protein
MKRLFVTFAAVAVLLITARAGSAGTPPATASVLPHSATSGVARSVLLPLLAARSPDPAPIELQEIGPRVAFADVVRPDQLSVNIPMGWITITGSDMPDPTSFASWRAAHPEVPPDVATILAEHLDPPGLSLLAFDAESPAAGITPRISISWIDAPVRDVEPWLAGLATNITRQYNLASLPAYRAWPTDLGVGVGAFQYGYMYSTQDTAMMGTDLVVPMADGRAAVLNFTCPADQVDEVGWIASAIFGSISFGG